VSILIEGVAEALELASRGAMPNLVTTRPSACA
jgi:hypothetical protein